MSQTLQIPINPREVVRGKRKQFTAAAKASYYAAGEYFAKDLAPHRFTDRHAKLAGYAQRSSKYLREKKVKVGHTTDLVYTGESQQNARMFRITTVAGTAGGGVGGYAKIAYYALRKLNYKSAGQKANMADEFRKVLPFELGMMGDEYEKQLSKELRK